MSWLGRDPRHRPRRPTALWPTGDTHAVLLGGAAALVAIAGDTLQQPSWRRTRPWTLAAGALSGQRAPRGCGHHVRRRECGRLQRGARAQPADGIQGLRSRLPARAQAAAAARGRIGDRRAAHRAARPRLGRGCCCTARARCARRRLLPHAPVQRLQRPVHAAAAAAAAAADAAAAAAAGRRRTGNAVGQRIVQVRRRLPKCSQELAQQGGRLTACSKVRLLEWRRAACKSRRHPLACCFAVISFCFNQAPHDVTPSSRPR